MFNSISRLRKLATVIGLAGLLLLANYSVSLFGKFRASANDRDASAFTGESSSPRPASPFASLSMAIAVAQDGLAVMNTTGDKLNGIFICTVNPTAGCDFSQNNGVVRTNDSVVYSYDYSVNLASEDITLTATAPMGTVWSVLPAFCLSGSTLSAGDGITTASAISCKRGVQNLGTAESLPFTATVLGSTANATVLTATGGVSGPSSGTVTATAPNVTVTAAPHYNLRNFYASYSALTFGGVPGYRVEYRAIVEVFDDSFPVAYVPRFGSAALSSPITFSDVVSQMSPNALLQSCVKFADATGSGGGNGGAIGCTQSAAGQNINVTITGADSTLRQWVTSPADNRLMVGTYQIYVFIPATDVTNAPGQSLSTTNTLTNFDPASATGQSNFDVANEVTTDNAIVRAFTPLTGSFGNAFVKNYNNGSASTVGVLVGSDRFVTPGEVFAAQLSLNNNSSVTMNNVVLCDVMDNTRYSVIETTPGSGLVYGNDTPAPTAVEYATGYVNANWMPVASGGNPTGIRAECNDPGITWYASPTLVPGGLAAITKFRVKYTSLAAAAVGTVRVRLQARENNFYTSQTNFNGAVLPTFGTWRSDEFNPNYVNNSYFPNVYPNGATGSTGARQFLARAIARITVETETNNTVNSVLTGGSIGYVLKPTLTTLGTPSPLQVTVMEVLPIGLSYIVNTGQQNSVSFEPQIFACTGIAAPDSHCTAVGQQILVWTLNNQLPNAAIAAISFRAAADLTVLNNQTVINTAIVSSPGDPSSETFRTATRNVTGASPSTLLVFKNSNTSQIEVNAPFNYIVSYRNASLGFDFTGLDFIDVLPFNGDANLPFDLVTYQRTPASSFTGNRTLTSVSATTGSAAWFFTNAAPATINSSPKFGSNLSPGSGGSIWCAGTVSGPAVGCGFTLAQTTAVRMIDGATLPRSISIRTFTLNFTSSGNQANDRYTNSSSGSALELALSVNSNNVPIVVLESSLSGLVWFDTNGGGVRGIEETGRVAGNTVTLTGTDNNTNPVNRTTSTASDGTYTFAHLQSGTYTVHFGSPSGYRAGAQDAGADDSLDSDGNLSTMNTAPITLGVNNSKANVDQGLYQLDLKGTIWRDLIPNGTLDVGESGMSGLTVELLDSNSVIIDTLATDLNGNYAFMNLSAGDYRVRVASAPFQCGQFWAANPNNDVDGDSNGKMQSGVAISNAITLNPGQEPTIDQLTGVTTNSTLDFGLVLVSPTATEVSLGGRVWLADGRGLFGARVILIDQQGVQHFAISNPFGYYRFPGIRSGTMVTVTVSAKFATFSPNLRLVAVNQEETGLDFVAAP